MTKAFRYFSVVAILLPMVSSCSRREAAVDTSKRGSEAPGKNDDLGVSCPSEAIRPEPDRAVPYIRQGIAHAERMSSTRRSSSSRRLSALPPMILAPTAAEAPPIA
jgi:hypothetical protein